MIAPKIAFWEGYLSDEIVSIAAPLFVYWIYAGLYHVLDSCDFKWLTNNRLHSRIDEAKKNTVSKLQVVRGVLVQQFFQVIAGIMLFRLAGPDEAGKERAKKEKWVSVVVQLLVASIVMDAWQYLIHRTMHEIKFLYRHIHSWHHRLSVPYSYGALYNHPLEGLLLDTVGGAISFLVSGMSPRTSIFFFSFATMKTVDDHCGMRIPFHPLQALFMNNAAYHDVHHQLYGTKFNYSQPFFITWDWLFGTYMPYELRTRADGGLEAHPIRKGSDRKALAAQMMVKATNGTTNGAVNGETKSSTLPAVKDKKQL